eukprot:CAMPEP_0116978244 /NCGR_PEP_ID=MMETSP0467-20121206/57659_1 /TAXON_ID=283647 /ORGANISM="Mesodinium pulex, Strain SPMC105" /LENGTH=106 /DNA_ID=CAMNT_0004671563 /DNA_START=279 /DNA_END=599 /DNA_ORIENTATION=-
MKEDFELVKSSSLGVHYETVVNINFLNQQLQSSNNKLEKYEQIYKYTYLHNSYSHRLHSLHQDIDKNKLNRSDTLEKEKEKSKSISKTKTKSKSEVESESKSSYLE